MILRPPVQLTVMRGDEIQMGAPHKDDVLVMPVTPVTPVSAEGIASLHSLIK